MTIYVILIALSAIFTIVSVIPYLVDIVRGNTKPRVVSWFIWSVLTAIAGIASFVDGQYPTAILLFFATIETMLVVILGWRKGDRKIERVDVISLIAALVGIVLWQVFNSPAIAVLATISIDLVGGIPTLIHSWKKPYEETWVTFLLAALGGVCTLLVVTDWRITAFAYPLYLVVINLLYAIVIIGRGRRAQRVRLCRYENSFPR